MRPLRSILLSLSVLALVAPVAAQQPPAAKTPVVAAADGATVHTYAGKWSIALPAGWTWHDDTTLPYATNGEAALRMMVAGDALPEGAAAIGFFPQDELDEIGLFYIENPEGLFAAFANLAGEDLTAIPLGGTGDRFAITAPFPLSPAPPPATSQLVVYAVDGAAFAFMIIANDFEPFADVARGIVTSTVVLGPIP
ncbi:MAG: hypothetical protein KIS68_12305 [Bauldia sp.]|nr:hypothetical protein [Bauldia sp.]